MEIQESQALAGLPAVMNFLIAFILAIPSAAGLWKIFDKAGKPTWAAVVPLYNAWILIKIVGRPTWWFFLLVLPWIITWHHLGPTVSFAVWIILNIDLAKAFGQEHEMGVAAAFLPFVLYPYWGFGPDVFLEKGESIADGHETL